VIYKISEIPIKIVIQWVGGVALVLEHLPNKHEAQKLKKKKKPKIYMEA
jgi:hypothetical protein